MARIPRSILRRALAWAILAVLLVGIPASGQISPGATKEDVIKVLGWPKSTSRTEGREILNYPECTVMMKDGRVEKLVFKTPEKRLRLWDQLNAPKPPASPATVNPSSSVPVQSTPRRQQPVAQPILVEPTPVRMIDAPKSSPWVGFATSAIVLLLILVVLMVAVVALSDGSRWGQLQKDMLRKRPKQPPGPEPPVLSRAPPPKRKPDPLLDGWSLQLLNDLEWYRFEQIVAAYETALGHDARLTGFGADGGVDVKVHDRESGKVIRLIQCKAYSQQVKVDFVRALVGVMAHEAVEHATFYTSNSFSKDSVEFARGKNMELIDGKTFVSRIKQLELPIQIRLFETAIEGDYMTPTCASCGIKMVRRRGDFWGCPNYPKCHKRMYGA